MPKYDDLSRSLVAFDQNSTLVAAIEMGSKGWLVGALVPGLERDPRKKLSPDKQALLKLLPAGYALHCCDEREREPRAFKGRGDPIAADRFFLLATAGGAPEINRQTA